MKKRQPGLVCKAVKGAGQVRACKKKKERKTLHEVLEFVLHLVAVKQRQHLLWPFVRSHGQMCAMLIMTREHLLQKENTFYSKRIPSIVREHIL